MGLKDVAEPTAALRLIPIVESDEPLIDFLEVCPELRLDAPRFHYRRESYAREGLVNRLCAANDRLLRKGYRLSILEGWRAPYIQRRMFHAVEMQMRERFPHLPEPEFRAVVEQYSAPMDEEVPPPHTTGGAVDLWLIDQKGQTMDLNSPFEWRDPAGFALDAPGLSVKARKHRTLLAEALIPEGVTNYPSEFWHWSYGDQGWAYRGDEKNAIYGATEPAGWRPSPEDDIDAPLEFVED
ncbi:M15 family metallopeptidase [soil metagenome]